MAEAAAPESTSLRLWAAVLAAGSGAVISHTSAAVLWMWDVPDLGIHVTVPRDRRRALTGPVRLHRHLLHPGDVVLMRNFPVTDRTRTLADCAALLPEESTSALFDRGIQKGWLNQLELNRLVTHHRKRPGSPILRRLVDDHIPGAHFEAERRLHRLLRAAGVGGWVPNHTVHLPERAAIVDVAFPEQRLAVEVDGRAHHSSPERFQSDRTRQNALVSAGWRVLRFTWADVRDRPDYVVATIRAQLH